jgi:hypothetical protein
VCLSHGWDIVATAPATSTLAGILAGFVFLGVATLITQKDPRVPQALALLSCAFVVLGFDSYLFGLVAGNGSDTDCARVWAESIPASGMLTVGGLAVITGISWLVAVRDSYVKDSGSGQSASFAASDEAWRGVRLDQLSRVVAVLAGVAVALLLTSTTVDYGAFAFGGRERFRIDVVAYTSLGLVIVGSLLLTAYRNSSSSRVVPYVAYWFSSYGIVIYAIVCTVFVGYTTNAPVGSPFVGVTAAVLGSVAPSILIIGLVQSIAPISAAMSGPPAAQHESPEEPQAALEETQAPPDEALPVDPVPSS